MLLPPPGLAEPPSNPLLRPPGLEEANPSRIHRDPLATNSLDILYDAYVEMAEIVGEEAVHGHILEGFTLLSASDFADALSVWVSLGIFVRSESGHVMEVHDASPRGCGNAPEGVETRPSVWTRASGCGDAPSMA